MEFESNTSCRSSQKNLFLDNCIRNNSEMIEIQREDDNQYSKLGKNVSKVAKNYSQNMEIKLKNNIHQAGFNEESKKVDTDNEKDFSEESSQNISLNKSKDIKQIYQLLIQKIKKSRRNGSAERGLLKAYRKQKSIKYLCSHHSSIGNQTKSLIDRNISQSKRIIVKAKKLFQNNSTEMSSEQQQLKSFSKEPQELIQSLTQEDINQLQRYQIYLSQNAKKICLNQNFKTVLYKSCWKRVEMIEFFGNQFEFECWENLFVDQFIFPDLKVIKWKTQDAQGLSSQDIGLSSVFRSKVSFYHYSQRKSVLMTHLMSHFN